MSTREGKCLSSTVVDLLRHGELEGGVKYRGSTEEALTTSGRRQMDATWAQLEDSVQVIVTSPLKRCRLPATAWAERTGIPIILEERFREMEYGAWEGLSRQEIEAKFPGMLAKWRANPAGMQIPDAEDIEEFAERVQAGWRAVLHTYRKKHVLVAGHSGPLRVILADVLHAPLPAIRRFDMPYGCWSRVRCDNEKPWLEFFNRRP